MLVYEHFKSLSQSSLWSMPFCKRAHYLRSINNEHGWNTLGLQVFSDKLVNQTCCWAGSGTVDVFLLAKIVKEDSWLLCVQFCVFGHLNTKCFFKTLHHWDSAVRWGKVDFINLVWVFGFILGVVFYFHGAGNSLNHFTQQFFCKRHQVIIVTVSPVEFASRKFRVVCKVDTFVSKLFTNFVNAV